MFRGIAGNWLVCPRPTGKLDVFGWNTGVKMRTKDVTLTTSRAIDYECPREGGWAYVLRDDSHSGEGSGRTKNGLRLRPKPFLVRLELIAVIKGLERLKVPCKVLLRSGSEDLLRSVSSSRFVWREKGWPKSYDHADLGQRLDEAAEKHIIVTQQIGSYDPDMKRCDDLARSQASWVPEEPIKNSSSPNIPTDLPSLAYLKGLSLHDLTLFLVKLLTLLFPPGRTFNLYDFIPPAVFASPMSMNPKAKL